MNDMINMGETTALHILGVITVIELMQTPLTPATIFVQSFVNDAANETSKQFGHGINFSGIPLHGNEDENYFRPLSNIPTQAAAVDTGNGKVLLPPFLEDHNDKVHNDVRYEINKSNQENTNSYGETADSSSSVYFERVELQESQVSVTTKNKFLLHRHKRYLLFPEGSSFQLVFDLIIPIVDYTNFAIMGITCAVAWELPSKPPSEIIDNYRNKLNDGTFGLSRRNDSTQQRLQYIKGKGTADTMAAKDKLQKKLPFAAITWPEYLQLPPRNYYHNHGMQQVVNKTSEDNKPGENWYGGANDEWSFHRNSYKWQKQNLSGTKHSPSWDENNWWERNKNRIQAQWQQNQWKWKPYPSNQRQSRNRKIVRKPPKHHIYPLFGKRRKRSAGKSVDQAEDDLVNKLHGIHIKQHLHSRLALYSKIEKLYKSRGQNGTACVMRTLCETYKMQRKRSERPNTFIMEILRAIFTLPRDSFVFQFTQSVYTDVALYGLKEQSCSRYHHGCKLPIWHE